MLICFLNYSCNNSPILCIVLAHSDDILITGCKNRAINLIRIDTGEIINTLNKHEDAVTALALSLDDTILISGEKCLISFWTNF